MSAQANHLHILAVPESARQLADFMRDFKSKLAREVNRLTGWSGPVFERRYEMTVVTHEDRAQIERLSYVLAQSVKEGLVERVREWPGVHSAAALIDGTPLEGHWFDHTLEYAARNQREEITRLQFAEKEVVILSPIPCWAHLPPDVYRKRIADLVENIESESSTGRKSSGVLFPNERRVRTGWRGLPESTFKPRSGRFPAAERLRRQPIDVLISRKPWHLIPHPRSRAAQEPRRQPIDVLISECPGTLSPLIPLALREAV